MRPSNLNKLTAAKNGQRLTTRGLLGFGNNQHNNTSTGQTKHMPLADRIPHPATQATASSSDSRPVRGVQRSAISAVESSTRANDARNQEQQLVPYKPSNRHAVESQQSGARRDREPATGLVRDDNRTKDRRRDDNRTADRRRDDDRAVDRRKDGDRVAERRRDDDRAADWRRDDDRTTDRHRDDERTTDLYRDDERTTDRHQDDERTTDRHRDDDRATDRRRGHDEVRSERYRDDRRRRARSPGYDSRDDDYSDEEPAPRPRPSQGVSDRDGRYGRRGRDGRDGRDGRSGRYRGNDGIANWQGGGVAHGGGFYGYGFGLAPVLSLPLVTYAHPWHRYGRLGGVHPLGGGIIF